LPASALSHAIDKVIYAAGISDVRFYLNGILFQANQGQISITASDGHRLAMARWQTDAAIDIESIIPVKTAQALTRTFSAGDIDLQLGRNAISAKNDANHLIGKCIDAKYPSFDKVFALARNNIAKLDSKALQEAIEAVAITADNKYHGIQCQFDQQLTLTATNELGETSEITLEIDYNGKPLTLGFCARYLKEALTKIDGLATLSIDDNASSLLLHGSDDSAVHVVMPMRI
jgi:DNA polymerase-3 subunit beta